MLDDKRQATVDRALAKAHEQARARNLPQLLHGAATSNGISRWLFTIGSRSEAGAVYRVMLCDDHGLVTTACDCPAVGICWHRASVRLAYMGKLACYRIEAVDPASAAD